MAEASPIPTAEASGWIGWNVDEHDGAVVGQVHSFFADAEGGGPTWLVAKLGRFGGRLVAIPMRNCAGAAGRVWVAHERAIIRGAPVVDPTLALLREHELAICEHYGIDEKAGRAAEVIGRPEGAVTSQPG